MSVTPDKAVPALRMHGINKSFAGVRALIDVNFEISKGEVVALVGDNGAGKSTLMNILGGVHQPDSGTIEVNGDTTSILSLIHI